MIELMRGVTAFLAAPIFVFLAGTIGSSKQAGIKDTVWICLVIAAAGLIGGFVLYSSGRPWLVRPDLERWQGGPDDPAWESPPLGAAIGLGRRHRTGSVDVRPDFPRFYR
jgi:hypothetical protein